MSVESMAIALHHSKAVGTAKLVVIGIANHDGDGGAWPSIATLAKYANYKGSPESNRKAIQKILRELEGIGEIRTHAREGGLARTPEYLRPNLYEFLLRCPEDCDGSARHARRGGGVGYPTPGSGDPGGGGQRIPPGGYVPDPGGGGQVTPLTVLEPSVEPSGKGAPPPSEPQPEPQPRAEQERRPDPYLGRCPTHRLDPNPPACGACADARRHHQAAKVGLEQRSHDERPDVRCNLHSRWYPAGLECGGCRADKIGAAGGQTSTMAHVPFPRRSERPIPPPRGGTLVGAVPVPPASRTGTAPPPPGSPQCPTPKPRYPTTPPPGTPAHAAATAANPRVVARATAGPAGTTSTSSTTPAGPAGQIRTTSTPEDRP